MEAEEIKAIRVALGLTQKDLADKLGIDAITVSRWERKLARPHSNSLKKLRRLIKKGRS